MKVKGTAMVGPMKRPPDSAIRFSVRVMKGLVMLMSPVWSASIADGGHPRHRSYDSRRRKRTWERTEVSLEE